MTSAPENIDTSIPNTETDHNPEEFREGPANAIRTALKSNPPVKIVLNVAQVAIAARADKFTQSVGVRAVEIAARRNASAVDTPDVASAAEELYPELRPQANPWQWAIMGIVAGAVISFLITILTPAIPEGGKLFAVIVAMVGLIACGYWCFRLIVPKKKTKG